MHDVDITTIPLTMVRGMFLSLLNKHYMNSGLLILWLSVKAIMSLMMVKSKAQQLNGKRRLNMILPLGGLMFLHNVKPYSIQLSA